MKRFDAIKKLFVSFIQASGVFLSSFAAASVASIVICFLAIQFVPRESLYPTGASAEEVFVCPKRVDHMGEYRQVLLACDSNMLMLMSLIYPFAMLIVFFLITILPFVWLAKGDYVEVDALLYIAPFYILFIGLMIYFYLIQGTQSLALQEFPRKKVVGSWIFSFVTFFALFIVYFFVSLD